MVLDLPPGFEIVKFSGEEYRSDPAEIEPQHLAPEDVTDETEPGVAVLYKDGLTMEAGTVSLTSTFGALSEDDAAQLHKGAAIYTYAEGLKALRTAPDREAVIAEMGAALNRAEAANVGDPELAAIRAL